MRDVVIVAARRTAIGSFLGSLAKVPAMELGSIVIQQLLQDTQVASDAVSEVIMGQILTAGVGQNPARQAAFKAGLPQETPALTINQVCGSGLKAVHLAAQAIQCQDAEIVIAGGQENMSSAPHILPKSRDGFRLGNVTLVDSMVHDGLTDIYNNYHMGVTAENVAQQYNISREDQDMYALASQQKASQAQLSGKFVSETVPITIPQKKGAPVVFSQDEFIRAGTTYETLAKLKPVFQSDGTVTAGNASGINDGAAAVMLMSANKAQQLQLPPLAYIRASSSIGLDPAIMGMGPVYATRNVLQRAGLTINDIDLIEVNEAFAAQAVAVNRELGLDESRVNVNGGAIALGHPIGASGCRVLVSLLHELNRRKLRYGLATLCIGGGMGIAMLVEHC